MDIDIMQEKKLKKKNWSEILFLSALFIFSITSVISSSIIDLSKEMLYIYFLIEVSAFLVFLDTHKNRSHLYNMMAAISCIVFYTVSRRLFSEWMFCCVLLIFAAHTIKSDLIVLTTFLSVLGGLTIVVTSSLVGLIPNYTFSHLNRTAYSLGFYYYSSFPYYTFFLFVLFCNILKERISWLELGALCVLNACVFYVSTTRLIFYLGFLLVFLEIILVKLNWIDLHFLPIKIIAGLVYPLAEVVSIVMAYLYNASNKWMRILDLLLSYRLSQCHLATERYTIPILGQPIEMHGSASIALGYEGEYFYIDSGYVLSTFNYGIVVTILTLFIYTIIMIYAAKNNKKSLFIWGLLVAIFSLINNPLLFVSYNPLLLLFGCAWDNLIESRRA